MAWINIRFIHIGVHYNSIITVCCIDSCFQRIEFLISNSCDKYLFGDNDFLSFGVFRAIDSCLCCINDLAVSFVSRLNCFRCNDCIYNLLIIALSASKCSTCCAVIICPFPFGFAIAMTSLANSDSLAESSVKFSIHQDIDHSAFTFIMFDTSVLSAGRRFSRNLLEKLHLNCHIFRRHIE